MHCTIIAGDFGLLLRSACVQGTGKHTAKRPALAAVAGASTSLKQFQQCHLGERIQDQYKGN